MAFGLLVILHKIFEKDFTKKIRKKVRVFTACYV